MLRGGWTLEETLTTPVASNISGYSDREFLTEIGMSYTTFYKLKNKGYTREDMQECLSQGIRPTDLVFKVRGVWYPSLTAFLRKFGYASTKEGIAPKIKSGKVKLEDIVEAHEQGIHLTSLSVKAGGKWYTSLSAMVSSFGCNPSSCSYFKKKFSGNVDWIYSHLVELQERRQKKEGVSLA